MRILTKKSCSCRTIFDGGLFKNFKKEIKDLQEFQDLARNDKNIKRELEKKIAFLEDVIKSEKTKQKFKGKYDKNDTFLSIYAGTGGRDAEDWVAILYRMYQKYLEKKGFQLKEIGRQMGEGGIKSVTIEIRGDYAFGILKGESGVHRLVRISPFSAKKLRHTSFALLEILPKIKEDDIKIKKEDLKIDTFRASGAGGQYVNRRESAVRVTHIPSGISVSCQSERLQGENKKTALAVLQSKLFQIKEKKEKSIAKEERGKLKEAKWGSQIRSYVFQPYQMVKDHRTGVKTSKIKEVLDGDINEFIEAELNYK